jgi:hypothetical protein
MDGDKLMSSVFSFDGNDWRMLLERRCSIFHFCLEPVDQTKTIEKLRGNYKLSIRKENNEGNFNVL